MIANHQPLFRPSSFFLVALFAGCLVLTSLQTSLGRPVSQEDQLSHDQQAKMEKQRHDEAFEKLKEDTQKLHQGAGELKDMIEKSGAHTYSLQIIRKTEELEKLLKDIKRRAKEGI
jgi:hypothetical protein